MKKLLPAVVLVFLLTACTRQSAQAPEVELLDASSPAAPLADEVCPTAPAEERVIYLTFDDGPGKYTGQLLDVLDQYGVKATFFVVGCGETDMIGEAYRRGHSIGIHSACHKFRTIYESEEAFLADVQEMSDIIFEQTGQRTSLIRFPGGSSNTVSNFNPGIMTRLAQAVEEQGYRYFDWNVASGDAGKPIATAQVVKNVMSGVKKNRVSVVLQHDTRKFSVAAVEEILKWGLENGYTFLPLTEDSPAVHHHIRN